MVAEKDVKGKGSKQGTPSPRIQTGTRKPSRLQLKMRNPPSEYVSLGSNSSNPDEEGGDMNLEDICDVVLSLKCKQCDFLCNDKSALSLHVRQNHYGTLGGSSKRSHTSRSGNGTLNDKALEQSLPAVTVSASSEKFSKNDGASLPFTFSRQKASNNGPDESLNAKTASSGKSKTLNSTVGDVMSDESVDDVFLCAECDIVFSSREVCCSHMHKVHGLNQFSADFIQEEIISKPSEDPPTSKCRKTRLPKQFTQDAGTIVPKKYRVTKDVFHTCSKCPIKFGSVEVMMFHEQCHVSPSNNDPSEEVETSTTTNKVKIEKKQSPGTTAVTGSSCTRPVKGFLCPVCESKGTVTQQVFPKWGACSWHLWKEHRIDCELHTCSVCKQFKSHLIARVKDHEQLHSTKASYKCKTCNKTFKQMKQLRCHEKYHKDNSTKLPPPSDSRWYTPKECPICKRILSDSKCLKKHISAVHNKLKPYVCNICGHTSARKAELQLHVRQHTGEKPYKCPICPFQTGDHNSLRKHKLRHSDERPYACPYCDYRCIQSCAFKKHIIACHPGQEVVFLCQLCSHASVNEPLFAAHQKDHAEGRITADSPSELQLVLSEASTRNSCTTSASTSSDNGSGTKYWSGDEDSIDIIDNGGVTIPASPQNISVNVEERKNDGEDISRTTSDLNPVTSSDPCSSSSCFGNTPGSSISKVTNSHLEPVRQIEEPNNFIILKTESRTGKQIRGVEITAKEKVGTDRLNQATSTSPQVFCVTASLQSLPATASPRHTGVANGHIDNHVQNQQEIRGNEDTESSSEVITNPHQLIENIQLTPLDLTDIIACHEQSNDDGMLQRLLDMSGV